MKTKTVEVTEVVILTPEQIEELPKEVRENVTFLTERVGPKDLVVLNPMVTELIEIRNEGKAIAFIKADEEGKFDKANIQEFVDIKKRIRSFRAKVKKVGKDMKIEPTKINKAIISIEKTFIAEATKVYDYAEKEFADYTAAELAIADAKQAEKDKALTDMIEASNKIGQDATLQLNRSNLYNKIKYEKINRHLVEGVSEAIINGSKRRLEEIVGQTNANTFELETVDEDTSIFEVGVLAELKEFFAVSKRKALIMLQDKITSIEVEEAKLKLEAQAEVPVIPLTPEKKGDTLPEMLATDGEVQAIMLKEALDHMNNLNDIDFANHIFKAVDDMNYLIQERLKAKPSSHPLLYDLRNILLTANKLKP